MVIIYYNTTGEELTLFTYLQYFFFDKFSDIADE